LSQIYCHSFSTKAKSIGDVLIMPLLFHLVLLMALEDPCSKVDCFFGSNWVLMGLVITLWLGQLDEVFSYVSNPILTVYVGLIIFHTN